MDRAIERDEYEPCIKTRRHHAQKKTYGYIECSEEKRQAFLKDLSAIPPECRVWVDETGMDGDESYPYGWSVKGKRCFASKPGKSTERISIIAGLCQQKLRGACWFTGYCNADVFNAWLEQALIPELSPGQTVILDNARFHQSAKTRELIEAAQCRLLFLPPYSPQDNLIEHAWFPLKNAARKIMQTFADLPNAIEIAILECD